MYAFGMLGSYFSQGVYAVAGPFQGAVDIIVVQQQDGTFKSSPWYVKCGDFQGVLTRREKIVDISVNGVPANFYMLLNSRGEAYFEKEVEDAVLALPSTSSSSTEDNDAKLNPSDSSVKGTVKGNSHEEKMLSISTQGNAIDQKRSQQDDLSLQGPPEDLDFQSSYSVSNQPAGLQGESDAMENAACGRDSSGLGQTNQLDSTAESRPEELKPSDVEVDVKPVVFNVSGENLILAGADSIFSKPESVEEKQKYGWPSGVDELCVQSSQEGDFLCPPNEASNASASTSGMDDAMLRKLATVITEDWFGLQEASSTESGDKDTSFRSDLGTIDVKAMDELIWNDFKIVTAEEERELHNALKTDSVLGVRIDGQGLEPDTPASKSSVPPDSSVWISDALVDDATSRAAVAVVEDSISMQNNNAEASADGATSEKDIVCRVDEGPPTEDSTEGSKAAEIPTIAVVPAPSRWTMWPLSFRRSRGEKSSVSEAAANNQALLAATNIAVGSSLTEEILRKNGYDEWTQKPKLRSYVPTSAQIESLKLKEGPNKVTFTFPRVLGRAQVDANIYLWKWNTRIVISDVDGTITKSDVLGQFMPLVGRDWSQSGVTRLFSAIKENGYEVLFLSARAISQAYLTRQFLINLRQDGETLPEGPVFISPDGLIPSLYREVVRRAPHEFKISCLEGIRRLFPSDVNPFYAGFGNRDTDEISYLKVGIPKGKIFIINPKGEVMVNHHVDVKSYTSIHALVDDMFPPVFSSEQEDFNSWNYWKLPLLDIDDELSSSSVKSTKGKKAVASKR